MKNFIIAAAIVGSGVAGFFIGKKVGKQEEAQNSQEYINSYKETIKKYEEASKTQPDTNTDTPTPKSEDSEEESEEPASQVVDKIIEMNEYLKGEKLKDSLSKKSKIRKENKYSKKHIDYDPEDMFYEDELDEEGNPPGPGEEDDAPYPISFGEYCEGYQYYDKKSVIYYEDNDTLIYDETDECILEDETLFGTEWRDYLYVNEICWIRNNKISTDFEIILKRGAYVQ